MPSERVSGRCPVWYPSRSIKAGVCPERSAVTDRCVASIVLPVPSFLPKIDNIFIFLIFLVVRLGWFDE